MKRKRREITINSKGHFWISLGKSLIRTGGCVPTIVGSSNGILIMAVAFCVAEILGIAEELVDKR